MTYEEYELARMSPEMRQKVLRLRAESDAETARIAEIAIENPSIERIGEVMYQCSSEGGRKYYSQIIEWKMGVYERGHYCTRAWRSSRALYRQARA